MGTNKTSRPAPVVPMSAIIRDKINAHLRLIDRCRKSGNADAVKRANARIRQLKVDLAREEKREARAA
jgi:hypothetical protein